MDRNQATGVIILTLFLMVYFYFFAPEPQIPQETTETKKETSTTDAPAKQGQQQLLSQELQQQNDSLRKAQNEEKYGTLSVAAQGEEEKTILENDRIKVTISNKGGIITQVQLKEYEDYKYDPLYLFDEESSQMKYLVQTSNGEVDLAELFFSKLPEISGSGDTTLISFVLQIDADNFIKHNYSLAPESYIVSHNTEIQGMREVLGADKLQFQWHNDLKRLERSLEDSRRSTTINYYTEAGDFDQLKETTLDLQEKSLNSPIKWLSFKQKYFTTGIVSGTSFPSAQLKLSGVESDTIVEQSASIIMDLPFDYFSGNTHDFRYFFGPNKFKELKSVTEGFHENLYLGWPIIKTINRHFIINVFFLLEDHIANYGLIIIILVLIVKLIISPLSYKSYLSMAKTRVLKPELDEIKARVGDDMQKVQQEQMKLYQQVGVNPLSGCIPLLLQMPILFAMFQFIPHAVELRHQSFLWAEDLSTFDSILNLPFEIPMYGSHVSLFTLLMTITTVIMTWYNNQTTTMTMQGPMKTMQYAMPVIFMVVLNKFPAGLTFYYFVSNVFSIVQQAVIRRFVDDEKIRGILEENKKRNRNKKKSKFQMKIEEALKASDQSRKELPKKGKA